MQFLINLTEIFKFPLKQQVVILAGNQFEGVMRQDYRKQASFGDKKLAEQVIDIVGKRSALKRRAKVPCTCHSKFVKSSDRLYLFVFKNKVIEFLRVGQRTFQHFDGKNSQSVTTTCLLDTSLQNAQSFNNLFVYFLQTETQSPHKLAYDNPSPQLLTFLTNYNLNSYYPQHHKIVLFAQYFTPVPRADRPPSPVYSQPSKQFTSTRRSQSDPNKHFDLSQINFRGTFDEQEMFRTKYLEEFGKIIKEKEIIHQRMQNVRGASRNAPVVGFGYERQGDGITRDPKAVRQKQDYLSFQSRAQQTQSEIDRLKRTIMETQMELEQQQMKAKRSAASTFYKKR